MIVKKLAISGKFYDCYDFKIWLSGGRTLQPHTAQFHIGESLESGAHEVRFFASTDGGATAGIQTFLGFVRLVEKKDDTWIVTCLSLASLASQNIPEGTNIRQNLHACDFKKPAGVSLREAFAEYSRINKINFILPASDNPKHYTNVKRSNIIMDPRDGFDLGTQFEMKQPFWVELPTGELRFSDWPDCLHADTGAIVMDRIKDTFRHEKKEIESQWINGIWPGVMLQYGKNNEGKPNNYYAQVIKITSNEKMCINLQEIKV